MLEEMIQNGFRKIGFLVGLPQISPTYERVKVYQQILKQYEIPETEQYVRYIDRKKDTYDVAGELVEAGCTAIIATNTAMTHSVLNYVEDRNLKLGEEIAVGGFVDSDFANRFMHRIPVVYEPMKEMGKLAVEALEEKKGEDVKIIDIEGVSVIADYFVLASASNVNQTQALVDNVEEKLFKAGYECHQKEGSMSSTWVLMDYGDVIVHVFSKEDRLFYDLERIWRDGKIVESVDEL